MATLSEHTISFKPRSDAWADMVDDLARLRGFDGKGEYLRWLIDQDRERLAEQHRALHSVFGKSTL